MIIDTNLIYALGFLAGAGLGFFYFGGLWLTVKKVPVSSNPQRLLCWSAVFRLAFTLAIFYVAGSADPVNFLIMLPGFLGVRYFLIRRVAGGHRRQVNAA